MKLFLFAVILVAVDASPIQNAVQDKNRVSLLNQKEQFPCEWCNGMVGEIYTFLSQPGLEKSMVAYINVVCSRLPVEIQPWCFDGVTKYGPIMRGFLLQLQPFQICTAVGMCGKAEIPKVEKFPCEVCTGMMAEIATFLSQPGTEKAMVVYLDLVCSRFPAELQLQCRDGVRLYVPLMKHFLQQIKPIQLCTAVGVCSKTEIPGDKIPCDVCHGLIGEFRTFITQPGLEKALVAYLGLICTRLPGYLEQPCVDGVTAYAPLLKHFFQQVTTIQLCTAVGMCTNTEMPKGNSGGMYGLGLHSFTSRNATTGRAGLQE